MTPEREKNDSKAVAALAAAKFVTSGEKLSDLPPDQGREVAFAGRSNTGKSSVINTLCRRKALARTSRTPGRTRQIVVFELDSERRLIDLPGFGFAKVARAVRAHWDETIPVYLEQRRSLAGLVLVVDVRHPLKLQEQDLLAWCAAADVPVHVLLNKSDKLSRSQARATAMRAEKGMREWNRRASSQLFSTHSKEGIEQATGTVLAWLGGN